MVAKSLGRIDGKYGSVPSRLAGDLGWETGAVPRVDGSVWCDECYVLRVDEGFSQKHQQLRKVPKSQVPPLLVFETWRLPPTLQVFAGGV